MTLHITQNNFGKGVNRCLYDGERLLATIHQHSRWHQQKLPDQWNVCWTSGRVDWHSTYAEARDNALKGAP